MPKLPPESLFSGEPQCSSPMLIFNLGIKNVTMPGNMACWDSTQWTGQKGQREEREETLRAGKGARDGSSTKGLGFYGCPFKQCIHPTT